MADEIDDAETLDELMSRDPLDLTDRDLDKIIAYQRAQRAKAEAGVRVTKASRPKPSTGGKSLIDQLGITSAPGPKVERRKI